LDFFLKIGHTGSSKWGKIFYKRLDNIAAELQLSGLTGTASHPDIHKFRIIGFFLENRLHWQFEVGKKISTNGCFRLRIFLRTNKTKIQNSLHVFDIWGEIQSTKRCGTITVLKCLTEGSSRSEQSAIRITSFRITGVLLYFG